MTQYTRPDSLPAWAESGAKVQPTNAEIQAGWPATNVPPSRQRFNWIFNWLANAVRYFLQLGVPEWSAAETYVSGARIQFGGATYKAVASSTNVAPDSDPAKWERWGFSLSEINALIAGATGFAKLAVQNTFTKGNVAAEAALPATTGSVVLDLALANNFGGTLTGNITLANPSNLAAGQSGIIRIVNDAATPRTIAYGAYWKSPGGSLPALTAIAGAVDLFGYYVESATRITIIQQADSK